MQQRASAWTRRSPGNSQSLSGYLANRNAVKKHENLLRFANYGSNATPIDYVALLSPMQWYADLEPYLLTRRLLLRIQPEHMCYNALKEVV